MGRSSLSVSRIGSDPHAEQSGAKARQRHQGIVQHQQRTFLVAVLREMQRQSGEGQRLQELGVGVALTHHPGFHQPRPVPVEPVMHAGHVVAIPQVGEFRPVVVRRALIDEDGRQCGIEIEQRGHGRSAAVDVGRRRRQASASQFAQRVRAAAAVAHRLVRVELHLDFALRHHRLALVHVFDAQSAARAISSSAKAPSNRAISR